MLDNAPSKKMDERELLAVLREEDRDSASFFSSELATVQAEAMERYYAEKYGDEVEGRSQVVTHDVEDAINWSMPHLMRLFIGNDELVTVEDNESDNPQLGDQIGEYLSHIFFKENAGEEILHDFAFDGMLQRIGWVRIAWADATPKRKILKNVPAERLMEYTENPEYEIIAQDSDELEQLWELEVRHTPTNGRMVVEQIPPEEMAYSSRASSVDKSDYLRRKSEEFVSELCREFKDKAHDLDPSNYGIQATNGEDDLDSDPRRQARHEQESSDARDNSDDHANKRKVDLLTEYIRIDYDGDGIVELRQVKRVGNTILENIEVDEPEYVSWSPIRVAHKLTGRSITDTVLDIQKIRTVITRKLLDSLAQSLAPRRVVNTNALGEEGINQLLDHDIGDVIKCEGDPNLAINELITPDVSQSAYAALEYFDQRSEEATGITRHAQGLKAKAITDTKGGIENLQAAANSRLELIGRWLGHGVERIFTRMYKLSVAHQDQPRMLKLQGKQAEFDPRGWSEDARITVHIGQAAETREARIAKLILIKDEQKEILLATGPDNPICSIKEYRETLALIAREAGFKKPERFFKEIEDDWQPPDTSEQPDPAIEEAKAKIQLAQQEAQAKQQLAQQEAQAKVQLSQAEAQQKAQQSQAQMQFDQQMNGAKLETDTKIAEMKFAHQREMDQAKLQSEREIAAMRIESEQQLAYARMEAEMELARWRTGQELELAKSKASEDAKLKEDRPGGRLDA